MTRSLILAATLLYIALPAHSFTNWQPTLPLISAASTEAVMETAVAVPKQRITYAQFVASQQPQQPTIASLIDRFIEEMDGVHPLGNTHRIVLRHLQRWPITKVAAVDLTRAHVIAHCQERRKTVCAATAKQDMTCLTGVLKYAGSNPTWTDCEDVSDVAIVAAKPFLTKHNLIGNSVPRSRRPTSDEKAALEAYFAKQNDHGRTVTDMVRVSRWQHASSRRIGESCALLWRDWLPDEETILVRKMKDPKNRTKQKVVALPWDAHELLLEWALEMNAKPELRDDEPRILPFNSHTCSQRYTMAKHAVGIHDALHLHDDRRDRISRLIEEGMTLEEAIQYSGHETTQIAGRTYMVLSAAMIAMKGRRLREQQGVHAD